MTDEALQTTYRILDASANRAGEGLRTMEEIARFGLDDDVLTTQLKGLRHALADAIGRLPRRALLAARDTEGDVGTEISEPSEYVRPGTADIVAAAATRTQQSLRVIEEQIKMLDSPIAALIEQIRYHSYTISAELELRVGRSTRKKRLQNAKLYLLHDVGPSEEQFSESVRRLFQNGVDVIQLRDQVADDRTLLSRARVGTEIARQHESLFIMNDRADVAVAADTDGVHVGQEELPAGDVRRIVGPDRLIGVSTHSIEQARQAVADGADYIGCGPVFPSRTKSFTDYVGTDFLKEVASEIEIPCFAIGGIDLSNLDQVLASGVNRIAVTGAIREQEDPIDAATRLRQRLSS